jgi:tetratricopeptide (TPR) repeat protein
VRVELLLRRAFLYNRTRQRDRALSDYTTAIALDAANVQAHRLRALNYAGRREFERALADYDAVIRLHPQDPEGHRGRGDMRVMQGRHDDALADYRTAATLDVKEVGGSLDPCRFSASLTTALYHCVRIAFDPLQPAQTRAAGAARLDELRSHVRPRQ